jgi:hypothetical protein
LKFLAKVDHLDHRFLEALVDKGLSFEPVDHGVDQSRSKVDHGGSKLDHGHDAPPVLIFEIPGKSGSFGSRIPAKSLPTGLLALIHVDQKWIMSGSRWIKMDHEWITGHEKAGR